MNLRLDSSLVLGPYLLLFLTSLSGGTLDLLCALAVPVDGDFPAPSSACPAAGLCPVSESTTHAVVTCGSQLVSPREAALVCLLTEIELKMPHW